MKKQFTATFKAEVARELLREEKTIAQIGSEHEVVPTQLHQWKQIAIKRLASLYEDEQCEIEQAKKQHEVEKEQLYAEIGRLTSEMNWLKKNISRNKPLSAFDDVGA